MSCLPGQISAGRPVNSVVFMFMGDLIAAICRESYETRTAPIMLDNSFLFNQI